MVDPDDYRTALEQLTQAIYNHEQWRKEVTRTLLCRLPCDERDVKEDAHRQCRFGQWYSAGGSQALGDHAAFVAVDADHARMHQLAATLLRDSGLGAAILPVDFDTFANAVDRVQLQLQTLKRELEDSLFRRDPLTGAESRVDMLTSLREMLQPVKRGIHQASIAIMDLDHFKAINDAHGHLVGDQVLRASAHLIKKDIRPYDKLFRYGGEEFLIAMPNTDLATGRILLERLREGLAAGALAHVGTAPVRVTASFGIASLDPHVSVEVSMDRADKAVYRAKTDGRNCVRAWEDQ
ncbi:MAG: diguanylate cyclase [Thermoanaerobaculia bacterium]|jgi:diguanylate cyclase (GGDEF)-like protein